MLREIILGVRMALRRWPMMLTLAGMIATVSGVLSLVLGDAASEVYAVRGGLALQRSGAVHFTPFYVNAAVSDTGGQLIETLSDSVAEGATYTSVIYNVGIAHEDFAGGRQVILLVGAAVAELFPELGLCAPAPCGMAGADVAGAPKHLYVAGVTVEISGTLPRSAALFDPRAAALPLDEVLLVRLTAPHLAELDQVEREEAVVNAVFLEPNESVVDRYVTKAQEAGLFLVPERLSASQARSFSDMLATSTRYLMAVSAFGALALFAFFGSVSSTITKYRGAFVIYRLYGAGRLAIWARVAAFLASVCLCLPLLPTLLCMVPGPPFSWGALCSIGILLVVFLAVFTQTVWKISRLDGVVEGG